jgi:hypothetical protein
MLFIVLLADDINAFAIVLDCGCLCEEVLVCFSKEVFAVFPFFWAKYSLCGISWQDRGGLDFLITVSGGDLKETILHTTCKA